eukprot:2706904-Pleurochrysis_carterae.AAC.2
MQDAMDMHEFFESETIQTVHKSFLPRASSGCKRVVLSNGGFQRQLLRGVSERPALMVKRKGALLYDDGTVDTK